MNKLITILSLTLISVLLFSSKATETPAFSLVGKWKGHEEVRLTYQEGKQETFTSNYYIQFNSDQSLEVLMEDDMLLRRIWRKYLKQHEVNINGYTWISSQVSSGYLKLNVDCGCPKKVLSNGTSIDSEYVEMFKKLRRSRVTVYNNDKIGIHITKANGEKHEVILRRV